MHVYRYTLFYYTFNFFSDGGEVKILHPPLHYHKHDQITPQLYGSFIRL